MPRFPMDWSSRDTPWGRSQAWGTPPTRVKGLGTHPVTQGHAGPSVPASWTNLVYKFGDFQGNKPCLIFDQKRLNSFFTIYLLYSSKKYLSFKKKRLICKKHHFWILSLAIIYITKILTKTFLKVKFSNPYLFATFDISNYKIC